MSVQVILFFKGPGSYGWSERFWYGGGGDVAAITTAVQALAVARAAILTNTSTILRARVATATRRLPIVFTGNGSGVVGTEATPSAPEEVALLYLFSAQGVGYNRPFLRGIPERVVNYDSYAPDATFLANVNTFTATLLNGNWNVKGSLSGSGTPTQYPISALTPTAPKGFTFIPAVAYAGGVGSKVRIHGTRVPGYSGLKTVVMLNAPDTLVTVGGAAPPVADNAVAPYYTIPGSFDQVMDTVQAIGISSRKAGRPFGLSRGRARTLYSQRQ